jgi:hypothetical protein
MLAGVIIGAACTIAAEGVLVLGWWIWLSSKSDDSTS